MVSTVFGVLAAALHQPLDRILVGDAVGRSVRGFDLDDASSGGAVRPDSPEYRFAFLLDVSSGDLDAGILHIHR